MTLALFFKSAPSCLSLPSHIDTHTHIEKLTSQHVSAHRDSIQYEVNVSGDFQSSQGGRGWLCELACVCEYDFLSVHCKAMSLLWYCSGVATQANLEQTLRVTVTFKNNLPLSYKIDNRFVTFSGSLFLALCEPLNSYLSIGKDKDRLYMCQHIYLYLYVFLWHIQNVAMRKNAYNRTLDLASHHSRFLRIAFISYHHNLLTHAIRILKSQIKAKR